MCVCVQRRCDRHGECEISEKEIEGSVFVCVCERERDREVVTSAQVLAGLSVWGVCNEFPRGVRKERRAELPKKVMISYV